MGAAQLLVLLDRVQINLAVETEDADVNTAQSDNAQEMNNVVKALVSAGVPGNQMKTTGYTITPVYQQDSSGILSGTVKSYQVTNTLQVTLNDTNMTGKIIDAAVGAGANQVNSIQFMLSDQQAQALRSQALNLAITNARSDADAVASALNVTITGTQSADISQGYTAIVYGSYDATAAASGKMAAGSDSDPIRRCDRHRSGVGHLYHQLISIHQTYVKTFLH